ncbi:hypothetical protein [Pseudomonas sp. SWI44]|uniref:hypothetical protein n=1 Tax=Pseudomonas sp. SWI44 TaxID=2083053 RepID=UPI000CE5E732|nr:hypothetical protein [Pseudomonas sp. SWI44]AVD85954.1 hypothetical protein C4Q26_01790 [Pseudomonas sp. SWI44]
MSKAQMLFPYLLITKHKDVGVIASAVGEGGLFQHNDGDLYSFLTTKSFDQLKAEFDKPGKEYALILVEQYSYNSAGGQLARVLDHIR